MNDPEREKKRRTLILADDHALFREGIRTMLAGEEGLEVVAEAGDGREAVELCRRLRPDLVLMDVRMPGMDGLAATRAVKADNPKTAVLVVTTHESVDYLLEAVRGGAAGYVLKESTKAELLAAVRSVLAADSPLDPNLAMRLLKRLADGAQGNEQHERREREAFRTTATKISEIPAAELPLDSPLTPREFDVLRPLCAGKTNRQIAGLLHLSLSTIKGHVERITDKLEVSDRTQAAVRAIEFGLVRTGEMGTRKVR